MAMFMFLLIQYVMQILKFSPWELCCCFMLIYIELYLGNELFYPVLESCSSRNMYRVKKKECNCTSFTAMEHHFNIYVNKICGVVIFVL